jgi:hypothetical protein
MRVAFGSFCLVFLYSQVALAGAWLQPQNHGILVLQTSHFSGDQFFDELGERQPQPRFNKYEANLYSEYGYSEHWTLGSNLFVNRVAQNGQTNFGLADSEFFARRSLYQSEKWMLSLQPFFKLNSYYKSYNKPLGGSRSRDYEINLLLGYKQQILSPLDYIDTRIGYRSRNNGLSNQIRTDTAYGIHLRDDLLFIPAVRAIISDNPSPEPGFSENGEQDYSLVKAELGILYKFADNRWLQASIYEHIEGVLAGAGRGISVGMGVNF